jgi:hypothetical protein
MVGESGPWIFLAKGVNIKVTSLKNYGAPFASKVVTTPDA